MNVRRVIKMKGGMWPIYCCCDVAVTMKRGMSPEQQISCCPVLPSETLIYGAMTLLYSGGVAAQGGIFPVDEPRNKGMANMKIGVISIIAVSAHLPTFRSPQAVIM